MGGTSVDDFDLTGRVAIITGGNSGIGLGMADALARAGCAISIWGRNLAREEWRRMFPSTSIACSTCFNFLPAT